MEIGWAEYVVFIMVLAVSVGIGIFYGCFGRMVRLFYYYYGPTYNGSLEFYKLKRNTLRLLAGNYKFAPVRFDTLICAHPGKNTLLRACTNEYLLANRQMGAFPVALSQICTAVSAIILLSNPVEVYLYGLQYIMVQLSFIPFALSLAYLYIPVYFNLNVNSAYEFIEIRFNRTVRLIVSLLAVVHVIVSMAIAIYAPSLAIQQVTGISTEVSTAVIYFVCIFYSAIGGLKAVLWTDVFQSFVMLASLLIIAGKGLADVGVFSVMWERASDYSRLEVLNFDPDPRTRHTIWTCIIAGYFFWLPPFAATQVQVQRFMSMPNMQTVKRSLLINITGLVLIVTSCMVTGLIIFAKYYKCDPISSKGIDKSDQLLPYFVKETVDGIPGLLGLFIAGLTCASMSSLSSGLTALASITTYDYINKLFPNLSDFKLSTISKLNTFLLGLVSYCFVFVIQNMGSILPVTSSFLGIMVGPTLGIFTLGMMFPWANAKGSLSGMILTFIITVTYVILNNINSSSLPDQRLPLSTDECEIENTSPYIYSNITKSTIDWKNNDDSFSIQILSISYMWYSAAGTIISILLGIIFSATINLVQGKPTKMVPSKCLSPPILLLFRKYFPDHLKGWVTFEDKDNDCVSEIINKE